MTSPSSLGHVTGWTVVGSYTVGIWCRLGRPLGTERAALGAAMDERDRVGDLVRVGVVTPRGDVLMLAPRARVGVDVLGGAA